MREKEREITMEQYINATQNHDNTGIFTVTERCGYGVYNEKYYKSDDKYYVRYQLGDTCD